MHDHQSTVRELANELNVSVLDHFTQFELNIWPSGGSQQKFVPKLLTTVQKQLHLEIAQDLLETRDSYSLNTVITGDEFDPETKFQSLQWKHATSLRSRKASQVHSNIKVKLTVFFLLHQCVHHEYTLHGTTIDKDYYQEVLHRLYHAVRSKWQCLWAVAKGEYFEGDQC